jgi:hypothetical protein
MEDRRAEGRARGFAVLESRKRTAEEIVPTCSAGWGVSKLQEMANAPAYATSPTIRYSDSAVVTVGLGYCIGPVIGVTVWLVLSREAREPIESH